jgi:Cysteine-rich secretory protein family
MQYIHTWMRIIVLMVVCGSVPLTTYAATSTPPALTAQDIVLYTNAERAERNLPALTTNDTLARVAAKKMADLFARQYFAHEAPTGEDVADLVKDAKYEYLTVGENLALGDFTSSRHVVKAWMDSPGHKANILSKAYSEIGVAAGRGTYEGRTVWISVQTFGLPRSSCPVADQSLRKKVELQGKKIELLQGVAEYRKKLLDVSDVPLETRKVRVDQYNKVVRLYNKELASYRSEATAYNTQIDRFNTCIKKKTKR